MSTSTEEFYYLDVLSTSTIGAQSTDLEYEFVLDKVL